ncbi:FAD-binding protein [Rhodoglobus aureus]|uniref:FAD-binding protein n=1 Tax=Rhodoglobus aureus TaxID=191497 RepID=UPI0031D0314F
MSINRVNWASNLAYSAEAILEPATVDDVQGLVARWPRVRASGTRHSFTDIADTPGALISLAGLDPDIRINPITMTASVTRGTSFGVLINELQAHSFARHNTGSLPHISVAGATATGTHGSCDHNGILSTAISAEDPA